MTEIYKIKNNYAPTICITYSSFAKTLSIWEVSENLQPTIRKLQIMD